MGLLSNAISSVKSFFNTPYLAGLEKAEQHLQAHPVEAALITTKIVAAPAVLATSVTAAKAAAPVVAKAAPVVAAAAVKTTGKIVTSAITNPAQALRTTIGAGTAIVGGSILLSSSKARTTLVETPGNLATFGTNVGKAIDEPSFKNIAKVAEDSPIITGALIAGGALIAAKAGGTIATIANTKAIKDVKDAIQTPEKSVVSLLGGNSAMDKTLPKNTLADSPTSSAVTIKQTKKQGKRRKSSKRKANIYKCQTIRRAHYGHTNKCYNFY